MSASAANDKKMPMVMMMLMMMMMMMVIMINVQPTTLQQKTQPQQHLQQHESFARTTTRNRVLPRSSLFP